MNPIIRSNASRYGLMAAALGIVYSLIAYLAAPELFVTWWLGILLWVATVAILIIGVVNTRKGLGGYIEFREAFTTYFLAALISTLISTLFGIVLFGLIDPDFADQLQGMIIEKTVEMMEGFGAQQADIDKTIEQMEGNNNFSIGNQVKSFFFGLIFSAVVGLIVAAATKRKNPELMA